MKVMKRGRGFTLVEMTVVLVVLVVMVSLIAPNIFSMQSAQAQRSSYGKALDFARQAREDAIESGTTYALAYDPSKSQFLIKRQAPPDSSATSAGNLPPPAPRPLANVQSVSDLQDVTSLQLPEGVEANKFQAQDNSVDPSSWLVHFYPDGTSDGGGVEIARGQAIDSLQVTQDGLPTLVEGELPDASEQQWQAGTYAQKI
jgi:prepilin-type N-terminal cleavage/methylation domain-containing protein